MNRDGIVSAFDEYIKKTGCKFYKELYVGVTNDVNRRLFDEHNVNRETNLWIYAPANNETIARDVETHYLSLGMRGGKGGGLGDGSAKCVYCYVIAPNTIE